MGFLKFPVYFRDEEDDERQADLGLPPNKKEGWISINSTQICSYNETDGGNLLVRMADGDLLELPIAEEDFEDILQGVENIFDLKLTYNN